MLNTERLVELRKRHSLTQNDVAIKLNTSRPNYVRYEKGNHQPPNETLTQLAKLFNVTTDYLLGQDNPLPEQKEKPAEIGERSLTRQEFIDFLDTLPEDQVAKLLSIARSIVHMYAR
jgi:transcriptional regulator with XRE-family HTH domain